MTAKFESSFTLNQIQIEILKRNWILMAAYFSFYAVGYALADTIFYGSNFLFFALNIIGWGLGYLVLLKILTEADLIESQDRGGLATYFAIGMVYGSCVYLGLILLILPGFYLMVRWVAAYPQAIVTGRAMDSLSESWEATRGHEWMIGRSLVIAFIASAGGLVLPVFAEDMQAGSEISTILLADLLFAVGWTWLAVLQVASYVFLRDELEHPS